MSLFTGAIATALGLGATVAGQTIGATKAANASETASATEAKTAQEALDYEKGLKAQQASAFAPYQQAGAQAAGNLASLARPTPTSGPPSPYTTQPRATAPMAPSMPPPMAQSAAPQKTAGLGPTPQMIANQPNPYGGQIDQATGAISYQPGQGPVISPGGPNTLGGIASGQMVLLQAPDGTKKAFAANDPSIPQYLARGAKRVS